MVRQVIGSNINLISVPDNGAEVLLKEIRIYNLNAIEEHQSVDLTNPKNLSRINKVKSTPRSITVKVLKSKPKEKNLKNIQRDYL